VEVGGLDGFVDGHYVVLIGDRAPPLEATREACLG
jgi:hypothetical protein